MTLDNFPAIVRQTVQETATEFGVDMDDILAPWPHTGRLRAARVAAIGRLDQMTVRLDGERVPMFELVELQAIFGVSRNSIARLRAQAKGYKPRRIRQKTSNGRLT